MNCNSPYINHLISSYQKNYNQNLESIVNFIIISQKEEEISFFSTENNVNNSTDTDNKTKPEFLEI